MAMLVVDGGSPLCIYSPLHRAELSCFIPESETLSLGCPGVLSSHHPSANKLDKWGTKLRPLLMNVAGARCKISRPVADRRQPSA